MKKLKIILLIVLIILVLLAIFNEITRSSILFFLNSKDVDLFKSKFADTYLSGNRTINTIGTDIDIPEYNNELLRLELVLSYFPKKTKLFVKLVEQTSRNELSVREKREFRGKLKAEVLSGKIDK
ncbi:MAG: hypothetical protein H8E57_04675, partial [Candidatus Cloacimonetes bacterium]|nr:hypothetical protein [Candidatus Cloacimonadota bacterium]